MMMRRLVFPFLAFLLLFGIASAFTVLPASAAPRCFPETPTITACIDGRLREYWEQQGGLDVFGYPISAAVQVQSAEGPLTVQRFERAVLEIHPRNKRPYDVLLARLGVDVLAQQGRDWAGFPKADSAAPHYFAETGHAIAPQFWAFWSSHGLELDGRPGFTTAESLALFGLPISDLQTGVNGASMQWFERARFEYHPENPVAFQVQLGLLGRETTGVSSQPQTIVWGPVPTAPPELGDGGFIRPAGAALTLNGHSVQIKGVNYYPQKLPWIDMWKRWNAPQIDRELHIARDQLGVNTIRIMFPYSPDGKDENGGTLDENGLRKLREVVQIAGKLHLRVIVTLFDFSKDFPAAGSRGEAKNIAYLRWLIGNFVNDDRIIAWDIHNEPDHYDIWADGGAQEVLGWLGRMADVIHQIDPNHMVTVGMGQYVNLWQPGPDGRSVLDYSDLVTIHSYNAADLARQLEELRSHTGKPIVLGEFGWPTGPDCVVKGYTETQQTEVYRQMVAAAIGRTAGIVAWTLRDFDPGPTLRSDTREEHYGLYRVDGSLKPASDYYKTYPGTLLPSSMDSDLKLTGDEPGTGDKSDSPMLVPGTGFYIKGRFRRAWELFGGEESFGLPLSEAFIRPDDERVVQYFQRGVFELYPEATRRPDINKFSEADRIALGVRAVALGEQLVEGRTFPAAGVPAPDAQVFPETGHTLQGEFLNFYNSAIRGPWRLGAPISEELDENINGVPTRVQYFQKGRLQWNDATKHVEISMLGAWSWDQQCASTR